MNKKTAIVIGLAVLAAAAGPASDLVTPDRVRAIEVSVEEMRSTIASQDKRLKAQEEMLRTLSKRLSESETDASRPAPSPKSATPTKAPPAKTLPSGLNQSNRLTLKQIEIFGSEKVNQQVWCDEIVFVESSVSPVRDRYYPEYHDLQIVVDSYVALHCKDDSGSGYSYIFCDKKKFASVLGSLRKGQSIGFRGTICSMYNGSYGVEVSDLWTN